MADLANFGTWNDQTGVNSSYGMPAYIVCCLATTQELFFWDFLQLFAVFQAEKFPTEYFWQVWLQIQNQRIFAIFLVVSHVTIGYIILKQEFINFR